MLSRFTGISRHGMAFVVARNGGKALQEAQGLPQPRRLFLQIPLSAVFRGLHPSPRPSQSSAKAPAGLYAPGSLFLSCFCPVGCEWFPRVFRVKSLSTNPQSWDAAGEVVSVSESRRPPTSRTTTRATIEQKRANDIEIALARPKQTRLRRRPEHSVQLPPLPAGSIDNKQRNESGRR
jgi:hypothetical protein